VKDWAMTAMASVVGSPALGPVPYMHRPSAAENPQSPLSHHYLDSTHATAGVLSLQLARGGGSIGTSWFRGGEADENRTGADLGPLDSWAVRGSLQRGAWDGQISGGRLESPDVTHPGDVTRL